MLKLAKTCVLEKRVQVVRSTTDNNDEDEEEEEERIKISLSRDSSGDLFALSVELGALKKNCKHLKINFKPLLCSTVVVVGSSA